MLSFCAFKFQIEKLIETVGIEERCFVKDKFKTSIDVRTILEKGSDAVRFLQSMNDGSKWAPTHPMKKPGYVSPRDSTSQTSSSTGITVSTHTDEEVGKYYFKVEGIISLDMLYIIAAFMEVSLIIDLAFV